MLTTCATEGDGSTFREPAGLQGMSLDAYLGEGSFRRCVAGAGLCDRSLFSASSKRCWMLLSVNSASLGAAIPTGSAVSMSADLRRIYEENGMKAVVH